MLGNVMGLYNNILAKLEKGACIAQDGMALSTNSIAKMQWYLHLVVKYDCSSPHY